MKIAISTNTTTWYLSSASEEPRCRISSANPAENAADTAISTGEKLARPQPTNPIPPQRSGCVGVNSSWSRDTRKRKNPQTTKIHNQRRRKKNKIGRLTSACHQPAIVRAEPTRSKLELLALTPK